MNLESPVVRDLPMFDTPLRPMRKATTPKGDFEIALSKARREYRKSLAALRPRCTFCGAKVEVGGSTLDHLVPVSQGGKDRPANLALCCRTCNQAKGGRTPSRWALAIVVGAWRHRLSVWVGG